VLPKGLGQARLIKSNKLLNFCIADWRMKMTCMHMTALRVAILRRMWHAAALLDTTQFFSKR
jgi:hypothetical protein